MATLTTRASAMCEDINATVLRIHTPEQINNCRTAYLNTWKLVKGHGFDTIFSSSYIYSTANNNGSPTVLTPRPQDAADGIHGCMINNGFDPAVWAATLQNEPDAGPDLLGGRAQRIAKKAVCRQQPAPECELHRSRQSRSEHLPRPA